jgi:hypothetical protein
MKKIVLFSGILMLQSLFFVGSGAVCNVENVVFKPGERLEYQLFYNVSFVWIQAGTCQFNVNAVTYNRKPALKLTADGKTYKSFDSFFRVRDTLVSYVDSQTLNPIRSYKFTHEDNWHGIDEYQFNKEGNFWRISTKLYRKKEWKPVVVSKTENCGFDIVTSLYRLRCLANSELYKPGKKVEIPVRLDDGEYKIFITYKGREKVKLHKIGYYKAHALTISLVEGTVFKRGDVLKLWISDDNNHIPLMVESPIRVGSVKAILNNAEKTLFPMQKPTKN